MTSTWRVALLACLLLWACSLNPTEVARTATTFVQALNAKDVASMTNLAATPFHFRDQEWKSTSDGAGFVLVEARERVARNTEELRSLLQEVATRVKITDATAVADPPSKADLLSDPLRGASSEWNGLSLVLFRRGEADVEHIAIVGIDSKGKVTGLYVN